jgi:hypothetical protein
LSVQTTELDMTKGMVLAEISPMTQPGQYITLKMPTAIAIVRGAEFGAETMVGQSFVGVFSKGQVGVNGAWAHEHVQLSPSQETRVSRSAVPQVPHGLQHFRSYGRRIAPLRRRAAYWRTHWQPIPVGDKLHIRLDFMQGRTPDWIQHRAPAPTHLRKS